jgi:hypothetical protein
MDLSLSVHQNLVALVRDAFNVRAQRVRGYSPRLVSNRLPRGRACPGRLTCRRTESEGFCKLAVGIGKLTARACMGIVNAELFIVALVNKKSNHRAHGFNV